SGFTNLGFDGIAVALLGANTAIGVVFAALLFGSLKVGALNMPTEAGIQTELVDIIIALIIFFVASSYMIRWVILRFKNEDKYIIDLFIFILPDAVFFVSTYIYSSFYN